MTGIAWMVDQEYRPIKGGILADACGLGKTLMGVGLVYYHTRLQVLAQVEGYTFKPSLLVVPAGLIDTWESEILKFFGDCITLKIFYGSRTSQGNQERKERILENIEELDEFIAKLDPDDASCNAFVGPTIR